MREHQFRKLKVWQKSLHYTSKLYLITTKFPKSEQFGLTSQLRRAVSSVTLNIAEGSGCQSNIEFIRFLYIAKRSAYEVITGIEIGGSLGYLTETEQSQYIREAEEICSMITGFIKTLKKT